jgi:hypothetical protein
MGIIKKATIISLAAAALASVAAKMIAVFSRRKSLLRMGKKGVSFYAKWKMAKFIERLILRMMGRREPVRGWRRMLWFARG